MTSSHAQLTPDQRAAIFDEIASRSKDAREKWVEAAKAGAPDRYDHRQRFLDAEREIVEFQDAEIQLLKSESVES